jgi:putative oxidoreductase
VSVGRADPLPAAGVQAGSLPAWAGLAGGLGRLMVASLVLYSGIFDMAAHWPAVADAVAWRGLPLPHLLGAAAMLFEIVVPVLLFVPRLRLPATLALILYCLATALLFHAFWTLAMPERLDASFHFFKNVALAGALLAGLAGAVPQARRAA